METLTQTMNNRKRKALQNEYKLNIITVDM